MQPTTTPAVPDLFAKARNHDRAAIMAAAQAADVLPYFRTLTSPALPVVRMEGVERIMLGSNNYLGLTGKTDSSSDQETGDARRAAEPPS